MRQDRGAEPATDTGGLPEWDETTALLATGGDADLARELLATLIQTLPADLQRLTRAAQVEDWRGVTDVAHRIRGATSYCGVPALDRALLELERTAKADDLERIPTALQLVEQEAERLRKWSMR